MAHSLSCRTLAFRVASVFVVLLFGGRAFAATLCVSPHGACYHTIHAAVAAASAGDVVWVQPGTYREDVTITKSLSLKAQGDGVTIDAKGLSNGIFVDGMSAAPAAGVSGVLVTGFRVINANFEGILVANASDVTLLGNTVMHNDRALQISMSACPGIPAFETNEGDDCGEGIHLMGADHSTIVRNEVAWNSGGILISDETGTSHDNLVSENEVHDNPYDCGITMASHGPATSVIPTAGLPYGLMRNTIAKNESWHNGTQLPGAGAGIGVFAPFPGTTASANVIVGNQVWDNGMPGITMHNHASAPAPGPPVNLNDNVIVGNKIWGNAADTADAATGGPTGINLYSTAPVTGTLIVGNQFEDEAFDIVFNAPGGQVNAHLNNFSQGVGVDNMGAGTVDGIENWWSCSKGPGNGNCASAEGTGVMVAPWLTQPYESVDGKH